MGVVVGGVIHGWLWFAPRVRSTFDEKHAHVLASVCFHTPTGYIIGSSSRHPYPVRRYAIGHFMFSFHPQRPCLVGWMRPVCESW
jgi:hypothetical protein